MQTIQDFAKQYIPLPQGCHEILFEDFNFTNFVCMKALASKLMGYGIIAGSLAYKIPQIFVILKDQSAKGLEISSYILETLGFLISLIYNWRLGNPFSTWGEYIFMVIQNVLITFLIGLFESQIMTAISFIGILSAMGYALLQPNMVNEDLLTKFQTATIPIFVISRIPQIYSNFMKKDCGKLSFLTVFMQLGGSAARVFTTIQEVNDPIILIGFVSGFVLNLILFLQLIIYGSKKEKLPKKESGKQSKPRKKSEKLE